MSVPTSPTEQHADALAALLDAMHRAEMASDELLDRARALPDGDLNWLLAWDAAATLGPSQGRVDRRTIDTFVVCDLDHRDVFTAVIVADRDADDPIGRWPDVHRSVSLLATARPRRFTPFSHHTTALLRAMQLIRDHLESALLAPPTIRQARIADFARQAGVSVEDFHRLAGWFSELRAIAEPAGWTTR